MPRSSLSRASTDAGLNVTPLATETPWGKVLAWDPPARLVLGWQLNARFRHDPAMLTTVEVTFTAKEGGGTIVHLEHRDLERFGDDAAQVARSIGEGWPTRLKDFVDFCQVIGEGNRLTGQLRNWPACQTI